MCAVLARILFARSWKNLREQARNLALVTYDDLDTLRFANVAEALVVAEDQRFYSHKGLDTKAITRALWLYITKRQLQGASTISQQLVRVLTGRYDRTLGRKLREVLLACLLDTELPKDTQVFCYLNVAYFGWRMNGVNQAIRRLRFSTPLSDAQATQIVARLKYPEPHTPSPTLRSRIALRAAHIENLLRSRRKLTNESP